VAASVRTHFRAVLFDWRGTLYYDESEADWIRAAAASIGRVLSNDEVTALVGQLDAAADHPDVLEARRRADCSLDLHREATMLELQLAGFDRELARASHDRDGDLAASRPYPDTENALRQLRACGVRIGILSDIHYSLAPQFEHAGLAQLVDTYTLSFEHDIQKPDARLFQIALESLGVAASEAVMVGDRASRDGGAISAGVTTLLLPPVPPGEPRGLEVVLRVLGCA
jgi:FMN phosphatase YigB (HAD superfamily)